MLGFACDPPIPVVQFVLWIYKMKMIYVRLKVVNQNVNIFSYIYFLFFCALQSLGKIYCKVVNAYLHVGVSIVYACIFKVGCSRHFLFTLATQHFALFLYRFTMENNDSSCP